MSVVGHEASREVPEHLVRATRDRPLPPDVVTRFLALGDLTPTIADALDRLDVAGSTLGSRHLQPLRPGTRVVGAAATLRYVPARRDAAVARASGLQAGLGDRAALHHAAAGDVLVIDAAGDIDHAVVGERVAERLAAGGIAGCVCYGAVRDVPALVRGPLPVWSAGRAPSNALHRLETAEVNGVVRIGALTVEPGDLVAADDNGIATVPRGLIEDVLLLCEEQESIERSHAADGPSHHAPPIAADPHHPRSN